MIRKKDIEYELFLIYRKIGIDTPSNHNEILDFVFNDVNETADSTDYHDGDVAIAFRRFLEFEN